MTTATTAPTFPRPHALSALKLDPKFDFKRDLSELTGSLPKEIDEGITLPIKSTHKDENGFPIDDWYASTSDYSSTFKLNRGGLVAALAGAQELAKSNEAVAVVQSADKGTRYVVPLAVWNPVDESELMFEHAGGTPYWKSAKDHVLLGTNESTADVEAVVFGNEWINMTGHPVKLPTA